jgi:hypothetical protein
MLNFVQSVFIINVSFAVLFLKKQTQKSNMTSNDGGKKKEIKFFLVGMYYV